jgi:hypothetical protein
MFVGWETTRHTKMKNASRYDKFVVIRMYCQTHNGVTYELWWFIPLLILISSKITIPLFIFNFIYKLKKKEWRFILISYKFFTGQIIWRLDLAPPICVWCRAWVVFLDSHSTAFSSTFSSHSCFLDSDRLTTFDSKSKVSF